MGAQSTTENTPFGVATSPEFMSISLWQWQASTKIAILLVAGLSVHISLSPPNPPAPPKQCITRRSFFEKCVRYITFCSKMMMWMTIACDILATVAVAATTNSLIHIRPYLCHSVPQPPLSPLLSPHPILILGALSTLLGALIRIACFRALGPLFTFELTISPTHTLVTSGPYAYVRHPSYSGVYLTLLGGTIMGLSPGTWLRECALLTGCVESYLPPPLTTEPLQSRNVSAGHILTWFLLTFWLVKVYYALRSTNRRLHMEDVELRKVFGGTWDAYAERVPWKLLPGVF